MSALSFTGQSVLVTGGASGIGRGLVEAFRDAGAHVAFTYSSSAELAADLAATASGRLMALHADLRRPEECERVVKAAEARFGGLSVVVTNAGGLIARAKTTETTAELWQEAFELNVLSTVFVVKAALPGMLERRQGSIVTMGSIAAHNGGSNAAHYSSMKGAIHTFTRALAKEAAPHVRVNGVSPGLIGTRFHDTFSSPEKRRATVGQTPLAREGSPADVAGAVLYLASPLSAFLTGEIIEVNGGIGMY